MKTTEIKILDNGRNGANWYFELTSNGFIGEFRIYFTDKTRKNARYKDIQALTAYFEGFKKEMNSSISYSPTSEVKNVTDAMLFVERNSQWILEKLERESRE